MTKGQTMANLNLAYVKSYTDKTGVRRHYFRKKDHAGGPLPGKVGSDEFMQAYKDFMDSTAPREGKKAGTFGRIITDYYTTADYRNLKPNSKALYRSALEPLGKKYGHNSVTAITTERVISIVETIGERAPQMANLTRSVLLKVLSVAKKRKWIARKIEGDEVPTYKGGTHHTWTAEELAAYEARWPLGTRERLAYALLLYTGQRGGDAARMTHREAMAGVFVVKQEKTGSDLILPIHPDLMAAIKAVPAKGLTIIGDKNGRPIKRRSLTLLMSKAIDAAELPDRCVPHGLRKAILTKLADMGASSKQMQAISGHKNLDELEGYIAQANQKKLAESAMKKLTRKRT